MPPHPLQSLIDEQIPGPLNGTVILDFSRHIPGPLAATLLENLGALVIRCESRSGGGDPLRYSILNGMDKVTIDTEKKKYQDRIDGSGSHGSQPTTESKPINPFIAYSFLHQYKAHIIMFDLEKKNEIELFHTLLSISDVIIESYRPGIFYNIIKLTPFQLSQKFPNLIVSSFTGFGQLSQEPGHDLNFVSQSGMMPRFIPNHLPILTQFEKKLSISSDHVQTPSNPTQLSPKPIDLDGSTNTIINTRQDYHNSSTTQQNEQRGDDTKKHTSLLQPLSALADYPQSKPLRSDPLQIVHHIDYLREFTRPLPFMGRNTGNNDQNDYQKNEKNPQNTKIKKRPTFPTLTDLKACYPVSFHDIKQPLRIPGMPSGLIGDCTGTLIGVNAILAQLFGRQKQKARAEQFSQQQKQQQKIANQKNEILLPTNPSSQQTSNPNLTSPNSSFLDISLTSSPLVHVSSFDITVPLGNGPNFYLNFELSGHFANYTIYQTKDSYITVAAVEHKFWSNIVDVLNLEQKYGLSSQLPPSVSIFSDEIFHKILNSSINNTTDRLLYNEQIILSKLSYNEYLKTVLQYEFIQKTTFEWIEIFTNKPSCITPVINATEAYEYNTSRYIKEMNAMRNAKDKNGNNDKKKNDDNISSDSSSGSLKIVENTSTKKDSNLAISSSNPSALKIIQKNEKEQNLVYTDCSAVLPIHPTKTDRILELGVQFDPPKIGKDQERVVGLLEKVRYEAKL